MQKHQSIVIRGIDRFQMIGFQGENSRELLLFQKILFFNVSKKKNLLLFFLLQVKSKNPNWILPLEQNMTEVLHLMWHNGTHKK